LGSKEFPLREVTRALGEVNPEWNIRDSIQPVLNVGSLAGLTPVYSPPVGAWGGSVTTAIGQFSTAILDSNAPGGTIIARTYVDSTSTSQRTRFGIFARPQLLNDESILQDFFAPNAGPGTGNLFRASAAVARTGNQPVSLFAGANGPFTMDIQLMVPDGIWVAPGVSFVMQIEGSNQLFSWSMVAVDIPIAQGGRQLA